MGARNALVVYEEDCRSAMQMLARLPRLKRQEQEEARTRVSMCEEPDKRRVTYKIALPAISVKKFVPTNAWAVA